MCGVKAQRCPDVQCKYAGVPSVNAQGCPDVWGVSAQGCPDMWGRCTEVPRCAGGCVGKCPDVQGKCPGVPRCAQLWGVNEHSQLVSGRCAVQSQGPDLSRGSPAAPLLQEPGRACAPPA